MPVLATFGGTSLRNYGLGAGSATTATVGDYESISTTTLATSQTSISISSIPQTYTHLQLRMTGRFTTGAAGTDAVIMQFNTDTTYTNYRLHITSGNGTSASSQTAQSTNYPGISYFDFPLNGALANVHGVIISDILDYRNTNKFKTVRSLQGADFNGSGLTTLAGGVWLSTSAITSIELKCPPGVTAFAQYSKFSLYGMNA